MSAPSRAVPFYCPYCADEDLRPFDPADGSPGHGQWRCQSCQRAFAVKYLGITGGWDQAADRDPMPAAASSTVPNTRTGKPS